MNRLDDLCKFLDTNFDYNYEDVSLPKVVCKTCKTSIYCFRKYKNIDNLFLQKEIFELHYKLIEEMPKCLNNFKCNITKTQFYT
jgi:hypothetical protein